MLFTFQLRYGREYVLFDFFQTADEGAVGADDLTVAELLDEFVHHVVRLGLPLLRQLRQQRERLLAALQAMPGIAPWPSQGNMILARVQDAAATFAALKARGVLIKNVSAMHPLLANCLRITVGTPEENTLLLQALQACLN